MSQILGYSLRFELWLFTDWPWTSPLSFQNSCSICDKGTAVPPLTTSWNCHENYMTECAKRFHTTKQMLGVMTVITMLRVCILWNRIVKKVSNHKKYSRCRNDQSAAFICKCLIRFWLSRNGIHPLFLGILGFKLGPYFFLKNKQTHFLYTEEVYIQ